MTIQNENWQVGERYYFTVADTFEHPEFGTFTAGTMLEFIKTDVGTFSLVAVSKADKSVAGYTSVSFGEIEDILSNHVKQPTAAELDEFKNGVERDRVESTTWKYYRILVAVAALGLVTAITLFFIFRH